MKARFVLRHYPKQFQMASVQKATKCRQNSRAAVLHDTFTVGCLEMPKIRSDFTVDICNKLYIYPV